MMIAQLDNPSSFRGASEAREPGIQNQAPCMYLDSGSAPAARPGMTDDVGVRNLQ